MISLVAVLALFSMILIMIYLNYPARQIRKWRQSLNLNEHQQVFVKLYQDVDGFALSKEARLKQDAIEFTYGEIDFESFIALINWCNPSANTVFYDLGSGNGKAVIALAMVFNVKKSCGIELFANLYQCSLKQQQRLGLLKTYQNKAKIIEFKQGNFLTFSFFDATLIFINASTFVANLWCQLSQHLEHVQPGTLLISTGKSLQSSCFKIIKTTIVKMSWGVTQVYIQERI